MKKSAALIMALLIISVVAIFAFTLARSLISSIARTGRSSDAMIAQEAAKGGIEWGLLQLKNCNPAPGSTNNTCYLSLCTLNFPTDATTPSSCTIVANKNPSERYADIWGSVRVDRALTGAITRTGNVYAIGQIAGVYKGLKATISSSGVVLGDYIFVPSTASQVDLFPNDIGGSTQWTPTGNVAGCSANWCVATTNDADTSYVSNYFGGDSDLYNITNSFQSGIINSVSVYYVARRGSTAGVSIKSVLKTGGSRYYGTVQGLTASYTTYSDTWATNPQTGVAWTWSDVDNLQIGLFAQTDGYSYVTQVYARVNYSTP